MELNRIYNEDCLSTLSRMEDNSIDLIITSPPYNKGYWSTNRNPNNGFHTKSRCIDYGVFDDNMPPSEYEQWQRKILTECCRVIKPSGSIWYNHIDILRDCRTIHPVFVYDFPIKQIIVWNRGNTPKLDNSYFFPINEWLFWIKKTPDSRPYFDKGRAAQQKSIWNMTPDTKNEHPAPFPVELPRNIIASCSKEGDIIYDPFMGSGTTALGVVTVGGGRKYIGSEISPDYVAMAEERISIATSQLSLF